MSKPLWIVLIVLLVLFLLKRRKKLPVNTNPRTGGTAISGNTLQDSPAGQTIGAVQGPFGGPGVQAGDVVQSGSDIFSDALVALG